MRYLLLAGLLLAALAVSAQSSASTYPVQVWPEVQGELALRNGDYLLLTLRGQRGLADGSYYAPRHLGFDAGQVRVGYEHFWSPQWSWGAAASFNGGSGRLQVGTIYGEIITPELLLRHRSPVFGGLTFGQRLSMGRVFALEQTLGGSGPDSQTWLGLRVDLERLYSLGGVALRPRLSYEAGTHLRLQKADTDLRERTIQFTSLRADVGVRLSPHLDITPWFAYQTSYQYYEPQTDASGVYKFGGNTNLLYPTAGLDLRFTILPAGTKADRQQLPTQH